MYRKSGGRFKKKKQTTHEKVPKTSFLKKTIDTKIFTQLSNLANGSKTFRGIIQDVIALQKSKLTHVNNVHV